MSTVSKQLALVLVKEVIADKRYRHVAPDYALHTEVQSKVSEALKELAGNSIVVACLKQIFYKMFINTSAEYGAPQCHSREQPVIIQPSLF